MNTASWVIKAISVHGEGTYDYREVRYTKARDKVTIHCPVHGPFSQVAAVHLSGAGCPECGRNKIRASRQITQTEFISRATEAHQGKYDYAKVVWVDSTTRVNVVCPHHGVFAVVPKHHISGGRVGCPECTKARWSEIRSETQEMFLEKAKRKHGDRFDYSATNYTNRQTKIKVSCRVHECVFDVFPTYHLTSGGCPVCAKESKRQATAIPYTRFLSSARQKFPARNFVYDETTYTTMTSPMRIQCEHHGWFEQIPYTHLRSTKGCPFCTNSVPLSEGQVIARLKKKFEGIADLSEIRFTGTHHNVTLRCLTHNRQYSAPLHNLLKESAVGCPICARKKISDKKRVSVKEFQARAYEMYEGAYTYQDYTKISAPVTVTCREHGDFNVPAYLHLRGSGCPKCRLNAVERPVLRLFSEADVSTITHNRTLIRSETGTPMEVDIYVPDRNLAIEINGCFWHSEKHGRDKNYHLHKTLACEAAGVRLIQIFDDECLNKFDIVADRIKHICRLDEPRKVFARNTELRLLTQSEATQFFSDNHLQGAAVYSVRVGLVHPEHGLICAAGFSRHRAIFSKGVKDSNDWELVRFATRLGWVCVGGLSKLISWFTRNIPYDRLVSYADRRWSTGDSYVKAGFKLSGKVDPGYWYVDSRGRRYHRYTFAKHKLEKVLPVYDPNLSDDENMKLNRYERLWDCGQLKFVLSCSS